MAGASHEGQGNNYLGLKVIHQVTITAEGGGSMGSNAAKLRFTPGYPWPPAAHARQHC